MSDRFYYWAARILIAAVVGVPLLYLLFIFLFASLFAMSGSRG